MATVQYNHETNVNTTLFFSMELSNSKWGLTFSNTERIRRKTIPAGDLETLRFEIEKTKDHFKFEKTVTVKSCYEAGRDGFWLHRYLISMGVENIVVDSASIEVNRRFRRIKTDRVDGDKLVSMLIRHHRGEKNTWSVLEVPSEEAEDNRRLHREIERLKKEKNAHSNRIRSLLITQGIKTVIDDKFPQKLKKLTTWDGNPLPKDLKSELHREYKRYELTTKQISYLMDEKKKRLKQPETEALRKISELMDLKAIGMESSWVFVMEIFAWRKFKNGKQLGSLVGLVPSPYRSGNMAKELGISKAGNRRVRYLAIEIAWIWLRWQRNSKITIWYNERFGNGNNRMKRTGIVAVARKVLIALWEYLEKDKIPQGAVLKRNIAA